MIPFHPVLVHFPIAFYVLEFILLVFWAWKKDDSYGRFALFTFRTGFLFMLLAAATGLYDAGGLDGIAGKIVPHFWAAASVAVLYTARAFFWKFGKKERPGYLQIQIASAALGNILVVLTGYFGGVMVYG